jgi:acyl carrier protein
VTRIQSSSPDKGPGRDRVLLDVRRIIGKQMAMPADRIQENHTLVEDLNCDSLDIVEITMNVEDLYDISVPDEYVQKVRTVGDMVDGVLHFLGQASPSR